MPLYCECGRPGCPGDLRCAEKAPPAATCDHDYECTYEGMDGERYRCKKCRDSYFLDYDEIR